MFSEIERIIPTLEGWCTVDKSKKMAEWISTHKPSKCVEIGVFAGRSLIAVAIALKYNQHGEIHGIDPWSAPAALEGKNNEENDNWWGKIDFEHFYSYTISKINEYGLQKQTKIIRSKSIDAVKYYDDNSLDFVHIDGNHSEETSTLDVNLWGPKVKNGGIIVFDDTNWETTKKAQHRLVELGFILDGDYDTWRMYTKKTQN